MEAAQLLQLVQRAGVDAAAQIEKMQQMLPRRRGPLWEKSLDVRYPANPDKCADGKPKAVVGMFAGSRLGGDVDPTKLRLAVGVVLLIVSPLVFFDAFWG